MYPESPIAAPRARVIAFYLPQFHPIPENNEWWGAGFTEWTNVAKAKPLFPGHWQPRLPADLGFYDLRVPEVRQHQADLARDAGIESFCYWHYWFGHGRRIIERPFQEVLASGAPNFPFCLAWANQTWSGIWHGAPNRTLMKQEYPGKADEEAHFRAVQPAFEDSRYTRVEGKPVFAVFAPHNLPSSEAFIDHWRELAAKAGFPGLYFVAIAHKFREGAERLQEPELAPFDAITPLVPQDYLQTIGKSSKRQLSRRIKELNFGRLNRFKFGTLKRPTRIEFADVVDRALEDLPAGERYLPSVLPGWDNTPRSGFRGVVYENGSPELFRTYMEKAVSMVEQRAPEKRIVFLKAWNEWAEGNYVEPDAKYGHAYLDAIRQSVLP